jgi:hypothetical protein
VFNVDPISIWLASDKALRPELVPLITGQNDRAFRIIVQYVDGKAYVVWPKSLQLREPVLPLPASSPYALH